MAKKPYPGMGRFVLLLDYGAQWVVHCGAQTEEKLRSERTKLHAWPDSKAKIVPNEAA